MPWRPVNSTKVILTALCLIIALCLSHLHVIFHASDTATTLAQRIFIPQAWSFRLRARTLFTEMTINAAAPPTKRASVYFLSHGGPNSMDDVGSGYYNAWVEVGRKVKAEQPKGIVFVSAHWESENGDSSVLSAFCPAGSWPLPLTAD